MDYIKFARAKGLTRTRIIFGLGLLLNALPYFDWDILRIPGMLQRNTGGVLNVIARTAVVCLARKSASGTRNSARTMHGVSRG